jgi:hypothetical protein
MTNRLSRAAGVLGTFLALAALGAPATGQAAVTRWNVQGVRPSYASQTISGYFDYDTVAGTVTGWSLNVSGIVPDNTNFVPPPNALLVPCGNPSCYTLVTPPAAGSTVGVELGFWDVVSSSLLYYVGLTLPTGADLTGATTQVINLVGGYPYSIAIATVPSTGGATGYTGFFVNGTITFAGSVVAGVPGGTSPTTPVALSSAVVGNPQIGQISTQLGGAYSCTQFYSFYSTGGTNWTATAAVIGATSGSSYSFELLNSRGRRVIQQVTLNTADNFTSPLIVSNLRPGWYVIGLVGNNPNDPPATISFTNPVTGHAPEDDGSESE